MDAANFSRTAKIRENIVKERASKEDLTVNLQCHLSESDSSETDDDSPRQNDPSDLRRKQ